MSEKPSMRRRRFLALGSGTGVVGVAGCTSLLDAVEDGDEAPGTESLDTDEPTAVVESLYSTWGEMNTELFHSHTEESIPDVQSVTEQERDLDPERFEELTTISGDALDSILDGEETALVEAEFTVDGETETERWALATENDDWKLVSVVSESSGSASASDSESAERAADAIDVISQVGRIAESGDAIESVTLVLQRSPGSDDVDLSELSVQWVGDNGFSALVHASIETEGAFYLDPITAESPNDAVMRDDSDRYQLVVPLAGESDADGDPLAAGTAIDNPELEPLPAGATAEIEITTAAGATRVVILTVPDAIAGLEPGERVEL